MNRKIVTLLIFFSFQAIFSQQEDKKSQSILQVLQELKQSRKLKNRQTTHSFILIAGLQMKKN